MLLEFSVKNYRSIRDEQVFTMVAEATKNKRASNTFDIELAAGGKVTLVRSAVMYGANASGKSNFIKAALNFKTLLTGYRVLKGEEMAIHDAFGLSLETMAAPTEYKCVFLLNNVKYSYVIAFDGVKVTKEELNYFPKKIIKNIYKRAPDPHNGEVDLVILNSTIPDIDYDVFPPSLKVFKTQPALAKFGFDIPDAFLNAVFTYFASWKVWSSNTTYGIQQLTEKVINDMLPKKGEQFFKKLIKLIKACDTRIDEIEVNGDADTESGRFGTGFKNHLVIKEGSQILHYDMSHHTEKLYSVYNVRDKKGEILYSVSWPFREESSGTNVLFALGAYILNAIEEGSIVFFDELDNSLHPKVARFLVSLFNNSTINKKNAQLVFTTHEANLIDRDMFRSDQIWFASKQPDGATEIYSAQDFEDIREDSPFDKWYLAGKFGALPEIQDIEAIFSE
ncbi:ATP/GTP-binding protein [Chitinophaga sp. CB10]|uniref:AAA family ATPase n=1 Tax=Chitinophaga sp. CB10 TaxID=1891659 RepID=UPI0025C4F033|nr:ATP-binding protein [Chitinophaga sp. CB10]